MSDIKVRVLDSTGELAYEFDVPTLAEVPKPGDQIRLGMDMASIANVSTESTGEDMVASVIVSAAQPKLGVGRG